LLSSVISGRSKFFLRLLTEIILKIEQSELLNNISITGFLSSMLYYLLMRIFYNLWTLYFCVVVSVLTPTTVYSFKVEQRLINPGAKMLSFKHLTSDDGLTINSVTAIAQDKNGYIWIGTLAGLNRYDAYAVKQYYNEPNNSSSLSNNIIRDILVDSKQQIWVATEDGLNRYDTATDSFIVYRHSTTDNSSINNSSVTSLFEDSKGQIWIGNRGGIARYISATDSFISYRHDPADPVNSMRPGNVKSFFEDSDGMIWVGTISGSNSQHRGLSIFDPINGGFIHFHHDPNDDTSLQAGSLNSIFTSADGKIWVTSSRNGLSEYLPATQTFRRITTLIDTSDNLATTAAFTEKMKDTLVDANGNIWIATYGGGLLLFDHKQDSFVNYTANGTVSGSLNSNRIKTIFQDRDGLIWLGTIEGGVNILNYKGNKFNHIHPKLAIKHLINSNISSILELENGLIVIGTYGQGLLIYDPETNSFSSEYSETIDGFNSKRASDILVLEQQKLLVASIEGLYTIDLTTKEKHYIPIHEVKSPNKTIRIVRIFRAKDGNIWLSSGAQGIFSLDLNTLEVTSYPYADNNDDLNEKALSSYAPKNILEDKQGYLWISTKRGLSRYDRKNKTFKHYFHDANDASSIPENQLHTLHIDVNNQLWLASANGLILFDRENEKFTRFSVTDGLTSNTVYCIAESGEYLWLGTSNGLTRWHATEYTASRFYNEDGLQSKEFNPNTCYSAKNNKLIFGGVNGFNFFDPNDIDNQYTASPVIISEIKLDDMIIALQKNTVIEVPYDNQVIQLEFRAVDYLSPERISYQIKMVNFDQQWRNLEKKNNTIYTNMDSGNYIFKVRSINRFGIVGDESSVTFNKSSHPLLSLWAIGGYLILLIIAIYLYRSSFLRQLALQKDIASRERQLSIELRKLSVHLQEAREEERSSVARELHDELAQILVAIKLEVSWVQSTLENEENTTILPRIPEIIQIIDASMSSVRTIAMGLRPSVLDDIGLIPAIKWYLSEVSSRANIKSSFRSNCEDIQLSKDLSINIYRIVQETITNVIKHANCKTLKLSAMLNNNEFQLRVADDGIGISHEDINKTGHFGLIGIRERVANFNGELEIRSNKPSGMVITITFPFPSKQ